MILPLFEVDLENIKKLREYYVLPDKKQIIEKRERVQSWRVRARYPEIRKLMPDYSINQIVEITKISRGAILVAVHYINGENDECK